MQREDFKDWDVLKGHTTHSNPTRMWFINAYYFRLCDTYKTGHGCGISYVFVTEGKNEKQVWVVIGKGATATSRFNLSGVVVPREYNGLIPLTKPKLDELKVFVADLVLAYIQRTYWDAILDTQPTPEGDDSDVDDPHAPHAICDVDPEAPGTRP